MVLPQLPEQQIEELFSPTDQALPAQEGHSPQPKTSDALRGLGASWELPLPGGAVGEYTHIERVCCRCNRHLYAKTFLYKEAFHFSCRYE